MGHRGFFRQKMVDGIGRPLMEAVTAVQAQGGQTASIASIVAELLNRSVMMGISMSESLDLKGDEVAAANARLAMTTLAAQLAGDFYKRTGRIPADADLKKIQPAFDTILSFADQLVSETGNPDDIGEVPQADEYSKIILYMKAMTPIIMEISAYSFGRPERKLVQEVAGHLGARAASMRQLLFPNSPQPDVKTLEAGILAALAGLYVECHKYEKRRLESLSEAERVQSGALPSLEGLWALFEERVSMLEMLSSILFDGPLNAASGNSAKNPDFETLQNPSQDLVSGTHILAEIGTESLSVTPEKPANPMAFFRPGAQKPQKTENNDSAAV